MRNKKALDKIRKTDQKKCTPLTFSQSIFKCRIASDSELEGTVPVMTMNQAWPTFVYPDIYLDGTYLSSVQYREGKQESDHCVIVRFTSEGITRLNALANDVNLTLTVFINSYPTINVYVPEPIPKPEITLDCFPTEEQAKFFYDVLIKEIRDRRTHSG